VFIIQLTKAKQFRYYIEEHYPFGDFALIRGREETAEVGFVFADEDIKAWPSLYEKAQKVCDHFQKRLNELGLSHVAFSRVGKDFDFITASIVIDLKTFHENDINCIADTIMDILHEVNPYHDDK